MNLNFKCFILILPMLVVKSHGKSLSLLSSYFDMFKEIILEKFNGNTQCALDIKQMFSDVVQLEIWAMEMLDASGKLPSGILNGNYYLINGNFDQCINIKRETANHTIKGQYCSVFLMLNGKGNQYISLLNMVIKRILSHLKIRFKFSDQAIDYMRNHQLIQYGLCIPESCSADNLQTIWDALNNIFQIPFLMEFKDNLCRTKDKEVQPSYGIDKYVIAFFGMYSAMICVCTLYDIISHRYAMDVQNSKWILFSSYTNFKSIFYSNPSSDSSMKCINGLKVLNMLWVLLGHRLILNLIFGLSNSFYIQEWKQEMKSQFFASSLYAVDTFFALSGFLLSNQCLRYWSFTNKKQVKIGSMYFFRLLRLSPALIATVLFYLSIFKHLGDGPSWSLISNKLSTSCRHTWWATVFFFSNFFLLKNQCVEQAWYVSVDSQLFFISPVLLAMLAKKPRKVLKFLSLVCVASGIYAFVVTVQNDYGAFFTDSPFSYYRDVYNSSFIRSQPWCIGFIAGYLQYKYQKIKLSKVTITLSWISIAVTIVILMYVNLYLHRGDYHVMSAGVFNACSKQIWALIICSIVFLCSTGNGGLVNDFLSLHVFRILVRISYSFFLVHNIILLYMGASRRYPQYFSSVKLIHDFFGDLVMVLIAALVWYLAFEAPFIAIGRQLQQKEMERRSVKANKQKVLKEVLKRKSKIQTISDIQQSLSREKVE